MQKKEKRILILGGGPTGLGAAYRLDQLGYKNWTLCEAHDYFGGHSSTHIDEKGFLWDEGGHVLFSHFPEYDQFVEKALGKEKYTHERECWIQLEDALVPYPFQNNIRYLKPADRLKALRGLLEIRSSKKVKPKNFKEWVLGSFGRGIADLFLIPYNFKVWATPAELMQSNWIGERVSVVDYDRILENVVLERDEVSWGPNNTFIFPKHGGTGEIYRQGAALIKGDMRLGWKASRVDTKAKIVTFQNGKQEHYDHLISAVPLPRFVEMLDGAPSAIKKAVEKLSYNSIVIVGIGLAKKIDTTKCWVYYTEKDVPFYRLTYFHNYSPYNVPEHDPEKYSSLMCEISYSKYKKIDKDKLVQETIDALIRKGVIEESDRKNIISTIMYDIEFGYPVPTLLRDKALKVVQSYLEKLGISSRGRYGAWKYEISNMDHCFMQGYEAVEKIVSKKKETVWS